MDIMLNGGSFLLPHLRFKKPFNLTCCLFCRPELEVIDAQNSYHAGVIKNPFECCDMRYQIYAGDGVTGAVGSNEKPVLEV